MERENARVLTEFLRLAYHFFTWITLIGANVLFWHLLEETKGEQDHHYGAVICIITNAPEQLSFAISTYRS